MPRLLQDQVVVITGASSGIGRQAALDFARAGARVVLAARNRTGLETLAREIRAGGGRALVEPTDVTLWEEVEELAYRAIETFGRIDTWVNNAGVAMYASVEQSTLEEMRQVMDVHYWGQVHGCKAAIARMRETGGGTIICVGSVLSDFSVPLQSTYCAAKHAIKGFTESLRIELAHDGVPIHVSLLKPASIDTPLFAHALTKLGVKPRPVPPVYDPGLVARAIVRCAVAPERELFVGDSGELFYLSERLMPRLYDWQQVKMGYAQQRTDIPKDSDAPNNLFDPLDEGGRVRDAGDGWRISGLTWMREHPRAAMAGAAILGAAVEAWRRRR